MYVEDIEELAGYPANAPMWRVSPEALEKLEDDLLRMRLSGQYGVITFNVIHFFKVNGKDTTRRVVSGLLSPAAAAAEIECRISSDGYLYNKARQDGELCWVHMDPEGDGGILEGYWVVWDYLP